MALLPPRTSPDPYIHGGVLSRFMTDRSLVYTPPTKNVMDNMDNNFEEADIVTEMVQRSQPLSFSGRRTWNPRPLSDATLIFESDNEEEDEEDEENDSDYSSPRSMLFDNVSQSTLSTQDEVQTPLTGGLGGFEFHIEDHPIKGPFGPHLFRLSTGSATSPVLSLSPIEILKQPLPTFELSSPRSSAPAPAPVPAPATAAATVTTVASLDVSQVRDWNPVQVAAWMTEAGADQSVVEQFLLHDIYGSVLLDLEFDDLKELDIGSFGKRHRIMSLINRLKAMSTTSKFRSNSCPISYTPLSRAASMSARPATTSLTRAPRPEESHVYKESSATRRGRFRSKSDDVLPAESISIVAIEQVLPEPHQCDKGENCPKWRKQQRMFQKLQREFAAESAEVKSVVAPSVVAPSVVAPSVAASSDVLGPTAMPITAASLYGLQPRDPQENVRQFLSFQHIHAPKQVNNPSPPPAPSASFAAKSAGLQQHLKGLPRLTIPAEPENPDSPFATPISALRHPTQVQAHLRAALQNDPYHYGGVASPVDVYRVSSPISATDIPVTAIMVDPCHRDASQSVPPEMRYGATTAKLGETIQRSASVSGNRRRHWTFQPSVTPVMERDRGDRTAVPPVVTNEANLVSHQGWMRKRRTTKLMKHEWQNNFFKLSGSKLNMHEGNTNESMSLEQINVDDYTLHAYAKASGSKLSATLKSLGGGPTALPNFAFSLIPDAQGNSSGKTYDKPRSHHFAVDNGRDRLEWMRKLMLAKAVKKNDSFQI